MTASRSPYSVTAALGDLQKQYEAEAAAAAAQQPQDDQGSMGQRLQQLEFNQMLMQQPMNRPDAGFASALWAGSGAIDPKTGKPAEVDPQVYQQRLQTVMQQRPDLLWPGTNRDGTIQREFTGDRYDR